MQVLSFGTACFVDGLTLVFNLLAPVSSHSSTPTQDTGTYEYRDGLDAKKR